MLIRGIAIALVIGLALTAHNFAVAHTDLFQTEPSAGAKVEVLDAIELYFTEPLRDAEVRVLYLSDSQPATTVINESTTHVTAWLDGEPEKGHYQVVWSATAMDDGHTISGSFGFEYDPPPTSSEMRAGIVLITFSVIAFVALLVWQRRVAAIKAAEKASS